MKGFMVAFAAATLTWASPSAATSFDLVDDFGTSVFSYGIGDAGSSFTPFVNSGACFQGTSCYFNTGDLPIVSYNGNPTPISYATALIAPNSIHMHPGDAENLDAIIRFTAPETGIYSISGAWAREDRTPYGTGVLAQILWGSTVLSSITVAPNSFGSSYNFDLGGLSLSAGDTIDFAVNRNSSYFYDSTSLSGVVSMSAAVPEPGTWVMMLLGFFGIGGLIRSQRRKQKFAVSYA